MLQTSKLSLNWQHLAVKFSCLSRRRTELCYIASYSIGVPSWFIYLRHSYCVRPSSLCLFASRDRWVCWFGWSENQHLDRPLKPLFAWVLPSEPKTYMAPLKNFGHSFVPINFQAVPVTLNWNSQEVSSFISTKSFEVWERLLLLFTTSWKGIYLERCRDRLKQSQEILVLSIVSTNSTFDWRLSFYANIPTDEARVLFLINFGREWHLTRLGSVWREETTLTPMKFKFGVCLSRSG